MASLDMKGPFEFTEEDVDLRITKTAPGNYALGKLNSNGGLIVQYVGRADSDVYDRIKDHLGEGYTHFKFEYASSPKAAFEKECNNYHDFGENKKLANKIHPDRPNDCNWSCPVCDIFD